jgi:hypothetical protein
MSDAVLYINSKGQPVTHSSYSARQTFKKCPRQFELERVQGWSDKEKRAAPLFGKCVEAGVQKFEADGRKPGAAVAEFVRLWADVQFLPEFEKLVYTDTEGDWKQLDRAGREMMRLYEIRAPFLPISTNPPALFQQVLRKKLFPGTSLDKLENKAIVDILSFPQWNHSMLPPIQESEATHLDANNRPTCRALIIDMKTSGEDLNTDLVMLDPQLAEYAWQGRIPDIGFLWFVKKGHEIEKGSRVTLLQDAGDKHAGYEMITLLADNEQGIAYVAEMATFMEYKRAAHNVKGNALKAIKAEWITRPTVYAVPLSGLTKQRLQFGAARLTEADMDEIGRDVAQTTVEMVRAHQEGYYPKKAGIRFPNTICNFCSMRWICLNRPKDRDEKLSRKGEEWLDGDYEAE